MIDDNLKDLPDLHAFRLLQRIGRGGFADVYLARQEHLDMLVAIKLLHNRLDGEDKLESFRQEARLIAQLEHPHIVRVLDFGIVEQTPYLVMNYASGGTLRQRVPRGSCLPLAQVVEYVSPLYSYLNENELPSLCLLAWLLLIGPVLGSRRAPLVVALVYSLVLTPLLLQGRIPLFAALSTTLAQIVITAGAGAWQERKRAYQFLSSLLLTLVSVVASISLNSFIFQQPLYCPFISISISHPTSLTILPIVASLLTASLEWIVSICMPSSRRLSLPQVKAQQHRNDIHDQRTQ
ncbi:hypothetical protein KSC_016240 [Ktedonobacter sp. SOSP1-52]|uniref:protein kinase domain-containing protein n=1 Tax=Ktedonobacter sp. SOSP1-52 TaxID=2778366 RepID=UPI0019167D62|nr:protein kinase [Ktedonobacter sp. SOSP1-52]GHO62732.1 hypothetical protein KSC_016240 [Ktedonobacter sp. SOSP1-52]